MTNLGQIRLFSNLTTIFFNDVGFGLMTWALGWDIAFLTGFKVPIYWEIIKISKTGW